MTLLAALKAELTPQATAGEVAAELTSLLEARGLGFPLGLATGPATAGTYDVDQLAELLRAYARRVGAERAAEHQLELLTLNRAELRRMCAVWGVLVPQSVQLTPQLQVAPLAAFAASDPGRFFLPHDGPADPQHHPKPRAALALNCTVDPVYFPQGRRRTAFTYDDKWALRDLVDLLSLVARCPTLWCAEWLEYPGASALLGGGGWSGGLTDRLAIHEPQVELTPEAAARFALCASQLPPLRGRLRAPLRRLNESHRREFASEKVIDVGIALESLLSEDKDPHDGITHRLKVRLARLLGGTVGEREANADLVGRFYALRSQVAHGVDIDSPLRSERRIGKKKNALTAQQVEDLVANVRGLCTRVIEAILAAGAWPAYRRRELGGD